MKHSIDLSTLTLLALVWVSAGSCTGQENGSSLTSEAGDSLQNDALSALVDFPMKHELAGPYNRDVHTLEPALQLRLFINDIAQDKTGAMWFGTNGYGVIRYKNDSLEYLTNKEGFMSAEVREMVEDQQGHIWFATADGLIGHKVGTEPYAFVQYTESDGLAHRDVRSLALDKNGNLWIGTSHGVSRLQTTGLAPGAKGMISSFKLPASATDKLESVGEARIVHSITADKKGRIWFGTDQGAYVYSAGAPNPFAQLSTQDGLSGDQVLDILEDKNGRMWFATKTNGVCYLEGGFEPGQAGVSFTRLETKAGHDGTEVADLFEDVAGSIWFSVNGVGTYRFAEDRLNPYFEEQSCVSHTFNTTFQDQKGRIWFGGWLGLFRYLAPC